MRHTNGPECERCEDMLLEAVPTMQTWGRMIRRRFTNAHFSCVWRGEKAQNAAFAEKASDFRWPLSKHNAMQDGKPASKAWDLFRLDDGIAAFPWAFYREIADWLKEQKAPINAGVDWKTRKDGPHFELKDTMVG